MVLLGVVLTGSAADAVAQSWNITSKHEVSRERKLRAYHLWQTDSALSFVVVGPAEMAILLRPVTHDPKLEFEAVLNRDDQFQSRKKLLVSKARLKTEHGRIPQRDVAIHLAVPAGEHRYVLKLRGIEAIAYFRMQAIKKVKKKLLMDPEVLLEGVASIDAVKGGGASVDAGEGDSDETTTIGAADTFDSDSAPASAIAEETPVDMGAVATGASATDSGTEEVVKHDELAAKTVSGATPELLAKERKKTFVVPLKGTGVDDSVVALLQNQLEARLGTVPNVDVVTTAEIQALLEHAETQLSMGCESDTTCLAELGQSADADLLLAGNIGKVGDVLMLSLSLIEPKIGQTVGRATVTAHNVESLVEQIPTAIGRVFGFAEQTAVTRFSLEVPDDGLKLAVMPLMGHGIEAGTGENLTQVVALELKNLAGISVISQDEIAAMLQLESTKVAVGCEDASCFAEIGGALGVDYLVIGSVGLLGDTYLVGLKLIETGEAKVANRVNEAFKGRASDLLRAAKFAVYQLVGAEFDAPGKLAVRVSPEEDFEIELDGEWVDDRVALTSLAPGRHNLRINAEGYYSEYLETYVEPGLVNMVMLELSELPTPWYKRWWVWTIGLSVVAGGVTSAILLTGQDEGKKTGSIELSLQRGLTNAR